jgi:hypothetical protein
MSLGQSTFEALMTLRDAGTRGLARETDLTTSEITALKRNARPSRDQLKRIAPAFGMSEGDLAITLLTGEILGAAHAAGDHAHR